MILNFHIQLLTAIKTARKFEHINLSNRWNCRHSNHI